MPGEGGHFVSKMRDFANKPWVIRCLNVVFLSLYSMWERWWGFQSAAKVFMSPPPSQQATGQQLYQILTFFLPSLFSLSPGSRRVRNEMCVFHATKRHINQHERISMTIPISFLSASGLHWEWQKEMRDAWPYKKTSSKHRESFCRGERMRRANANENSTSERAKTDDVHSNVQQ